MKRALYLGRFQLFHLGHLDVLQHIDQSDDVDEIVIAIGSTQYDWRNKSPEWPWANNPFTYDERREMIVRSIDGVVRKPYVVQGVPDTHEHESWFAGLCSTVGEFACLFSSDERERTFFQTHGKQARNFPRKYSFHAGSIRRRVADGVDVTELVPEGTRSLLERIDIRERMNQLYVLDGGRPTR